MFISGFCLFVTLPYSGEIKPVWTV